jgi:hypothetical protein
MNTVTTTDLFAGIALAAGETDPDGNYRLDGDEWRFQTRPVKSEGNRRVRRVATAPDTSRPWPGVWCERASLDQRAGRHQRRASPSSSTRYATTASSWSCTSSPIPPPRCLLAWGERPGTITTEP